MKFTGMRWNRYLVLACVSALLILTGCQKATSVREQWEKIEQANASGNWRLARIELKKYLADYPDDAKAHALLGKVELELGHPGLAEEEIRQAISLGMDTPENRFIMGKAWVAQGDYRKLLNQLSPEVAQDDNRLKGRILSLRGHAALALSLSDQARHEYEEAMRVAPKLVDPVLGLIRLYRHAGDARAEELLQKLMEQAPNDARVWLEEAELRVARGELDKALESYRKAARLHGDKADVLQVMIRSGLVWSLLTKGDIESAAKQVAWLKEHFPNQRVTRYFDALIKYISGDLDGAENRLRSLLAELPDNPRVNLLAGAVALARGNPEQANHHLQLVLQKRPNDLLANRLMAHVRLLLDQPEGAIDVLKPLTAKGTRNPWVYKLLIEASLRNGLFEEARKYIHELEAALPPNELDAIKISRAFLIAGDSESAIRALKEMGGKNGELASLAMEITNLLAQGKVDEADKKLVLFRKKGGDTFIYHNLSGMLLVLRGKFDEARQSFRKAASENRNDLSPRINLARLEEITGRVREARKIYQDILAMQPKNLDVLLSLALLELRSGETAHGMNLLQQVVDIHSDSFRAWITFAQGCLATSNPCALAASQKANELARTSGEKAFSSFIRGRVLSAAGRLTEAVPAFQQAVRLGFENEEVWNELGDAYMKLGQHDEAEKAYSTALDRKPDQRPALVGMVRLAMLGKDFEGAERWLRELELRYPEAVETAILEATLHQWKGHASRAREILEAAFAKNPDRKLLLALHEVLKSQNDPAALELLQSWVRIHPEDIPVRRLLADEALERGELELAEAEYERLLRMKPDDPRVLNNLAWLRNRMSRPRALELARKAYRLLPESPNVADTYGWILYQKGEIQEAAKVLERAVRLSSGKDQQIRLHYEKVLRALNQTAMQKKPEPAH